ncbi:MAG: hypothetical protein SOV20_08815 [Coriobacteriales bacterium]|nr:hypothetical protein [Coriobacteriaceae bacterium]MDY2723899.1 hypothetical protein [Coriobacteriales bacterium]
MVDSVAIVVGILASALDVPVSTEIPEQRPDRFVLVGRDGGGGDEFVDKPRILTLCWGTSDSDVEAIASDVFDALSSAAETDEHLFSAECETKSGIYKQGSGARCRIVFDLVINQ